MAATGTIAELKAVVSADVSQAMAALTGLGSMMSKSSLLALGAVGIGVGIAAIGGISLKMAGDFQSAMTTLQTGAGELPGNMKMVHDGILSLSEATGESTQQLINGMFMIESAGYHGGKGLDVLKAAAEGAKVGNADLMTVADATTTVMKDFADKNITATQAVNLLIGVVKLGKTHMEDLAGSISTVLPVASKFGISLGDVMAGMATMTSHGIAAANAATYLRQMIVSLEAPTSAGAKALASVGLTAQDVVNDIKNYGLPETLEKITEAIGKHFPAGSSAALTAFKEIAGGSRQMQGMLALTGSTAGEFAKDAGILGGAVHSTSGTIDGWALVQKNLNQKVSEAWATVHVLMIELGEKLIPVATQLVTAFTTNVIPTVLSFITMIQGSSHEAEVLRPILIAVALVIGGALVAAFVAWTAAAIGAAIATIAATWEVLAVGAAIALLVAGIIWAYQNWGWFRDAVNVAKTVLGDIAGFIGAHVMPVLGDIAGFIASHAIPVFEGFAAPIGLLINFFQTLITIIQQAIGVIGNIAGAVGNAASAVQSFVGGAISKIPGFAGGGTMPNTGLALVGEQGPELLALPGGATITPAGKVAGLISGPPAGMSLAPAAATGTMNGQPIQVTIYLDRQKVGMAVASAIPEMVRLATGRRS